MSTARLSDPATGRKRRVGGTTSRLAVAMAGAMAVTTFLCGPAASAGALPEPGRAIPGPAQGTVASSTAAASVSTTADCDLPVVNEQEFPATFTASGVPTSIDSGSTFTIAHYGVTLQVPASLIDELIEFKAKSPLQGQITAEDVAATDASPSAINAVPTPVAFSAPFEQGSPADLTPPSVSVGPFTAGSSGTVRIDPGDVDFSGQFPVLGVAQVTCTLAPVPTLVSIPITVVHHPLRVTTTSLHAGHTGIVYADQLGATGGTVPYHWSVASGHLPSGLHLDGATGEISGVPARPGTTTVAFGVTDSARPPHSKTTASLMLVIRPPPTLATAYQWGTSGDPGNRSTTVHTSPVGVTLPTGFDPLQVAAGADFALARTYDGHVFAWGEGADGQLGDGTDTATQTPTPVSFPVGTDITSVAAGSYDALALTSTGALYSWGENLDGTLGTSGQSSDLPTPVALPGGARATAIAAGGDFDLAVTSSGALYAWGDGSSGQLGDGRLPRAVRTPVAVSLPMGAAPVTAIAAGGAHGLAVTSSGALYAWGDGSSGQLGDGKRANSDTPVAVRLPAGDTVIAAAAGAAHSVAITSGHALFTWGFGARGQLGDGKTASADTPVAVALPAGATPVAVTAGESHTVALGASGQVYDWGAGGAGQLGDHSFARSAHPVEVWLPPGLRAIAIGSGPFAVSSLALVTAH